MTYSVIDSMVNGFSHIIFMGINAAHLGQFVFRKVTYTSRCKSAKDSFVDH